ncbi:hypothetical protein [Mycobacterium sp.]|uniref:hypothetical protein n=1 Tax=Mycobacterium sp. TaxID=1785 RepID=UPI003A856D2E
MSAPRGIGTCKNISIRPKDKRADDPGWLVGITAGDLWQWAWPIADLTASPERTALAIQVEFAEYFNGYRHADTTAWMATHIAERTAALLDGDRGWP